MPPFPDSESAPESARSLGPDGSGVSGAHRRPSYDSWYSGAQGGRTLDAQLRLLGKMISTWPRRGYNLLELCCGSGFFLESFWEAGLDVTGHEEDQLLAREARSRLGKRAGITLGSPEHMPFDDHSFDYVACINGLEFCDNPGAVLREAFRLATMGIIIAFPNSLSLPGLRHRLKRRSGPKAGAKAGPAPGDELAYGEYKTLPPSKILEQVREYAPEARLHLGSTLLGPTTSTRQGSFCEKLHLASAPLALGGCVMLRLDFAAPYSGTLLPLTQDSKKKGQTETAMAKGGLASRGSRS